MGDTERNEEVKHIKFQADGEEGYLEGTFELPCGIKIEGISVFDYGENGTAVITLYFSFEGEEKNKARANRTFVVDGEGSTLGGSWFCVGVIEDSPYFLFEKRQPSDN